MTLATAAAGAMAAAVVAAVLVVAGMATGPAQGEARCACNKGVMPRPAEQRRLGASLVLLLLPPCTRTNCVTPLVSTLCRLFLRDLLPAGAAGAATATLPAAPSASSAAPPSPVMRGLAVAAAALVATVAGAAMGAAAAAGATAAGAAAVGASVMATGTVLRECPCAAYGSTQGLIAVLWASPLEPLVLETGRICSGEPADLCC